MTNTEMVQSGSTQNHRTANLAEGPLCLFDKPKVLDVLRQIQIETTLTGKIRLLHTLYGHGMYPYLLQRTMEIIHWYFNFSTFHESAEYAPSERDFPHEFCEREIDVFIQSEIDMMEDQAHFDSNDNLMDWFKYEEFEFLKRWYRY